MVSNSVQAGLAACEWKTTGITVMYMAVILNSERQKRKQIESNFLSVLPVSERRKVPGRLSINRSVQIPNAIKDKSIPLGAVCLEMFLKYMGGVCFTVCFAVYVGCHPFAFQINNYTI
jgi:hypothetical protein